MIFYVDKINGVSAGRKVTMLPVAIIERRYKGDKGLRAHEVEHIKQYCVLFVIVGTLGLLLTNAAVALPAAMMSHDLAYTAIGKYRLWCEVKAYKKQIQYGFSIDKAAAILSKHYRLNLTVDEAKKLLQ
ncbi:hypothetical protein [Rheinheimera maricola]|uniref:Peptidase n=1 Tax=Rheinheimera maricola TaxID=2793282 RepID=A0ABS7XBN5_9GAMM|nr:hypothetical protein [Rheinheimera maricola]MBZ9612133.1 hypothetical protein [Rheinheimera maricola]